MTTKKSALAEDTEDAGEPDAPERSDEARTGRFKGLTDRVRNRSSRKPGKWSGKIGVAAVALVTAISLLALGLSFWFFYKPDRDVDAEAAKAAIAAASDGTIAILSYSPDTLDRDFSTARSHLTGDFLSYYDQFTQQIVAPAAKQKAVKTTAVVLRGALTEFHPESAIVLLFINQSTQSRDRPEPTTTSSSVLVTLTKADGKWLISQFNPA